MTNETTTTNTTSSEYGFNHEGRTYFPSGTTTVEESPEQTAERNAQLAAEEITRFLEEKPERMFLYIRLTDDEPQPSTYRFQHHVIHNVRNDSFRRGEATTFTGAHLGSVKLGREYRVPAFGTSSTRVPVTIHAINGCTYYGTYYKSSGDYARVRKAKEPKARGGKQS